MEILNWNIILIIVRLRANFCWLMKHIKIKVKTKKEIMLQIKLINENKFIYFTKKKKKRKENKVSNRKYRKYKTK